MIRAAAALGVESFRYEKLTGVFTEHGKVGAIGVRVTRGVTYHGFAFNVDPDLTHYRLIVPCGMPDVEMTSLGRELGVAPPLAQVARRAAVAFARRFDLALPREACTAEEGWRERD